MATAVVKFNALADAVGAAAKDDDLALLAHLHFIACLVGGVVVGRIGLELTGAGIDQVIDRGNA